MIKRKPGPDFLDWRGYVHAGLSSIVAVIVAASLAYVAYQAFVLMGWRGPLT